MFIDYLVHEFFVFMVVHELRREFHYGVTTADEGLRPISPLKLKLPPPPSGRRFQTSQKTLFSLVMFI